MNTSSTTHRRRRDAARDASPRLPSRRSWVLALLTAIAMAPGLAHTQDVPSSSSDPAPKIAIGSKNFEESRLLGEMFAQLLEERAGFEVERRFNLGGTQICLEALKTGAIDIYPEYTGTGLVSILGLPSSTDPAGVLNRVRQEFAERWDLVWLAPLGFENAYAIGIRDILAEEHNISTISGLATIAPELRAAFGFEFIEREDGLPGLSELYGLQFKEVRGLQQNLKYEAAGNDAVDVIDVYTTDGHILKYGLEVLRDDRRFFPPYAAAPLVRGETLRRHPEIGRMLGLLSGILDEERMRGWNLRLQEEAGATPEDVARDALVSLGLLGDSLAEPTTRTGASLGSYMVANRKALSHRTLEHLGMVAASLALAVALAIPLGLWLERRRESAEWVIRAVGLLQTIPSIALLAFMIPLLGVGLKPAIAALFLYALLPVVRNTYTGVRDADPEAVSAAWALGMTQQQILRKIRLPLAIPVIMAGVRTAAVINVGTATLAAFIGAGGLGQPIVAGLQLSNNVVILSGAIPAALLALVVDASLAVVERWVRPRGLVTEETS